MDNNNALLATLVGMVRLTPNDAELGRRVRSLISSMMEASTNNNKDILKG